MDYGLGTSIALPTGRRLVISDIHGCAKTLNQLILQLDLNRQDQLFFLGDYINKGPDSLGVIAAIQQLIDDGYQVFPLLGNHDKLLLEYLETDNRDLIDQLNGSDFLRGQVQKLSVHHLFFKQLAAFYVSGEFLLVHAGFDFSLKAPYADLDSMLTIRDFEYHPQKADYKTIVHGHSPRSIDYIQTAILDGFFILPLDNGCVYKNRDEQGNLLCLNLDTFNLWVQPNIDHQ